MDLDEIRRYLFATRAHSITVDAFEPPEAPGYVRTVTIHRDYRVTIEFETCRGYVACDIEGGGPKYTASYEDLGVVIEDLEDYLGRDIADWRNYTAVSFEPAFLDEPDPAANLAYFEDLVRRGGPPLPKRAVYGQCGIYWRHIARYGEWRPDKLHEEQLLWLSELGFDTDSDD